MSRRAGALFRRRRRPGVKAAWRAADLALPLIAARAARSASRMLPEGKDPDDVVRKRRRRAVRRHARRGARRCPSCCGCARRAADLSTRRSGGPTSSRGCGRLPRLIGDDSLRYHYEPGDAQPRPGLVRDGARAPPRAAGPVGGRPQRDSGSARARGPLAASERLTPLGAGAAHGRRGRRCAKRRWWWRWPTIRR